MKTLLSKCRYIPNNKFVFWLLSGIKQCILLFYWFERCNVQGLIGTRKELDSRLSSRLSIGVVDTKFIPSFTIPANYSSSSRIVFASSAACNSLLSQHWIKRIFYHHLRISFIRKREFFSFDGFSMGTVAIAMPANNSLPWKQSWYRWYGK